MKMTWPSSLASRRVAYGIATGLAVLAGLASRAWPEMCPEELGKYPGDALWALMVFFALGVVAPAAPVASRAVAALGVSFAVEFSQLYHTPWIDGIRRTTLGHLVLGYGFSWSDLVAYTAGVVLGAACESLTRGPGGRSARRPRRGRD
jgi:hypothetical protein